MLDLKSSFPSASAPELHVVTAQPALSWADLTALGVPLTPGASYAVALSGVGPFASLDDACGATGMGASFPTEQRWSYAPTVSVDVTR